MTQTARPVSDFSIGQPNPDGTSLDWPAVIWSKINTDVDQGLAFCQEDMDYPTSANNTAVFTVILGSLVPPVGVGTYKLTIHARAGVYLGDAPVAPDNMSGFVAYDFRLIKTGGGGGSLIRQSEFFHGWITPPAYVDDFSLVDPNTGVYHVFEITLTAPEIALITDWSALRFRYQASINAGDAPFNRNYAVKFTVGLVKFEVPDGTSDMQFSDPAYDYNILGGLNLGNIAASVAALVLLTDGSGIYGITPGQFFDRVYSRNSTTNETVDITIPNPFFETTYLGD